MNARVMKRGFTPVPSMFARPMVVPAGPFGGPAWDQ